MANNNDRLTGLDRLKRSLGRAAEQSAEVAAKAAKRSDDALTTGAERAGVLGSGEHGARYSQALH